MNVYKRNDSFDEKKSWAMIFAICKMLGLYFEEMSVCLPIFRKGKCEKLSNYSDWPNNIHWSFCTCIKTSMKTRIRILSITLRVQFVIVCLCAVIKVSANCLQQISYSWRKMFELLQLQTFHHLERRAATLSSNFFFKFYCLNYCSEL